jgi:hypothetical protein
MRYRLEKLGSWISAAILLGGMLLLFREYPATISVLVGGTTLVLLACTAWYDFAYWKRKYLLSLLSSMTVAPLRRLRRRLMAAGNQRRATMTPRPSMSMMMLQALIEIEYSDELPASVRTTGRKLSMAPRIRAVPIPAKAPLRC